MNISFLIFAVVVIIVAAVLVWCVDQFAMRPPFGTIARVLIVLIALLIILQRSGLV